jgi:hypothetical protein
VSNFACNIWINQIYYFSNHGKGLQNVIKAVFGYRNNEHGKSASAFRGTQALALFDFPDAA